MHTDARQDLDAIADGWPKLAALLPAGTGGSTWPPARSGYLRALDEHDAEDVARYRAERSELALGERPVPLSLEVFDAMRGIETVLCDLADQIAATIQRPAMNAPHAGRGWTDELHLTVMKAAAADAGDPRRWRYGGTGRTAPHAARWLAARLAGASGPFKAMSEEQAELVATVAHGAAQRLGKLIGSERTDSPMDRPCPWCAGDLVMRSGGDDLPRVTCQTGTSCTAPVPLDSGLRVWSTPEQLAGLERALTAADRRRKRRDAKRAARARARAAVGAA